MPTAQERGKLRMENVDLIVTNGTVLTMDERLSIVPDGFVCARAGRIRYIGSGGSEAFSAERTLDAEGGLILPGLVNAHTHAAMCLFRGLADDLPLMEWLDRYIFPVESRMDGDFVYVGSQLACAEMILSGTTTFCDMYLFENEVARAASSAGVRCLVGEVLYDFPSPNYGPIEEGFSYVEGMIRRWRDDPLVSVAVEPHSLYTCSPGLLHRARRLARSCGVPLILHLAETENESETIRERYGKSPVGHLAALGLLGPDLIADHCVPLGAGEIERLARHGVRAVHNPESNMKLASGVAPVPELLARGVTVGLGTDGCASNNNLDLFSEMDTAAKLHKVHAADPTILDAASVVQMATIEGARALGMASEIGSLEVGKKADIITVSTQRPHLTPMYNPYSHLVYAARGADVLHSVIDGRPVMVDRQLQTLDVDAVMDRANEKAELVRKWIG
jgi:5-methylthioadenosine/S-adenosylhomocysteine deaminase